MNEDKKVAKSVEKLVMMVSKLEPPEFIGVCKILGVEVYDVVAVEENEQKTAAEHETAEENQKRNVNVVVRPAEILIDEVIDKIAALNRTQRRNLEKLLRPATKGR